MVGAMPRQKNSFCKLKGEMSTNVRKPAKEASRAPRRRRDRPVDPERTKENVRTVEIQSRSAELMTVSRELPPPKFAARKATEPRNDPLWLDADVITGETGFSCDKSVQSFDADAGGYETLVEEEYNAVVDQDKNFSKSVLLSAYQYFHNMLYWYKGALMAEKQGIARVQEQQLIAAIETHDVELPAGAAAYLSGMGDFEDELGVKHKMCMKKPNGDELDFLAK